MKPFYTLFITLLIAHLSYAQNSSNSDTVEKKNNHKIIISVEEVPEFPGGIHAFINYLSKNLRYPEVARLIGINGKLNVSFVVDTDGRVTDVTPNNCIGAGCEAEASRLLEMSPTWKPGIQNSKPVRVRYTVPISFSLGQEKVRAYMQNLRKSDYGFVFNIKNTLYTIDEAEKILGNSFMSDQIEIAEPFYNYNKVQKFEMPNKKEVYLLILKST
jgi:protein TonB